MNESKEKAPVLKHWTRNDDVFRLTEHSEMMDTLPMGVYNLRFSQMSGYWIAKVSDEFAMPSPMYGAEADFVAHVMAAAESMLAALRDIEQQCTGMGGVCRVDLLAVIATVKRTAKAASAAARPNS